MENLSEKMTVEQNLKNARVEYISDGRLFQAERLGSANGLRWSTSLYIQGISKYTVCWNKVNKVETGKVGMRVIIRDQIVTLKDIVMTLTFILSDLKNHWTF